MNLTRGIYVIIQLQRRKKLMRVYLLMLRYAYFVLLVHCQLAQRSYSFRLSYSRSCRADCGSHVIHNPLRFAFYLRYSSSDDNVEADRSHASDQRAGRLSRPSIPVIGPIPLAPPLMVGDDMIVKQPTPMQWTTFEEARWIHMNSHNMSLVDASPIVAVIDEVTGYKASNGQVTGRYATIAAIMGVQQLQDESNDEIIGGSYSTFTESSSVRLYGIGRAVLCEFYNRIPSAFTNVNAEEDDDEDDDDEYMDDDFDNTYLSSGKAPIIMAEFELLYDADVPKVYDDSDINTANFRRHASAWSTNFWSSLTLSSKAMDSILASKYSNRGKIISLSSYNNNYQQNKKKVFDNLGDAYTSPAASIANLARFGGQVNMMHDSRRSLVSGIIAAKRRLQNYYDQVSTLNDYGQFLQPKGGSKWLWNEMTDEWEQDSSSSLELEWEQETSSLLLEREQELILDNNTISSSNEPHDDSPENHSTEQDVKSVQHLSMRNGKTVNEMENYGLSYYGAFSSLSALTEEAMRRFKPYYSPSHREREEYTYEVQSFVAWKALEGIVSPSDIAWCLLCTSAKDRLLRAYDIMYEHRLGLEELVDSLSQELNSCGEECTDLW